MIQKAADSIREGADKIEGQCTLVYTGLNRLLAWAKAELARVTSDHGDPVADVELRSIHEGTEQPAADGNSAA